MGLVRKQIATFVNNAMRANDLGEAITIAEDLSNISDFGVLISGTSTELLADFKKRFLTQVDTHVINKLYEEETYNMLRNASDFVGAKQRVMAKGLLNAQNSYLGNHSSTAGSYLDGKFYDVDLSSRLYNITEQFKIAHSIDDIEFLQFFKDETTIEEFANTRAVVAENTYRHYIEGIAKRALLSGVAQAYDGGRILHLITEYNNKYGTTETWTSLNASAEKKAMAANFAREAIRRIISNMRKINDKYNDGEVLTFVTKDEVEIILLDEFVGDINFTSYFGTKEEPLSYNTIPAWQNTGTEMLPGYDITSTFKTTDGTEEGETTYANIVGAIYTKDGVGLNCKLDRITEERVGAEGFSTFFHHTILSGYVDPRNSFVVIALD